MAGSNAKHCGLESVAADSVILVVCAPGGRYILPIMGADEQKSEPAGSGSSSSQDHGGHGAPAQRERSLQEIVDELSLFPLEAFCFVEEGLAFAANEIHGPLPPAKAISAAPRHITGTQLCEGLRRYALLKWGLLAQTVLRRWNITCTLDFGRIVFALIEAGRLQKTDHDSLDDFRNVFDFRTAFEQGYQIE